MLACTLVGSAVLFSTGARAQTTPLREFFADTFGDPLDYSNVEDVALVDEGPIEGVTNLPTLANGKLNLTFTKQGYFSPLWGSYDTGGDINGSDAIGHDHEGNIHPIDPAAYTKFRVRMNVSAAVGGGIMFYTCTAGVRAACETQNLFVTQVGWKVYEATLPTGKPVTGIRVAVSPEAGQSATVEVDWAQVVGQSPGNTLENDDAQVLGPVPEVLNPDVAGAVPFLFPSRELKGTGANAPDPLGGGAISYTAPTCPNNDWATTVLNNAWDFNTATDIEKLDNFGTSSVHDGYFEGEGNPGPGGVLPGDPGIRLNVRTNPNNSATQKAIDPAVWHRNTLIVPKWEGNYSQQFEADGGWVYRALWKFQLKSGIPDSFQQSLPVVEYPNDRTLSFDLDDPNPYDGGPVPEKNSADLRPPNQFGWSGPLRLGRLIRLFRVDLSEPYKPRKAYVDTVLLSTDDCAPTGKAFEIVFGENTAGVGTSAGEAKIYSSPAPTGQPWTLIGETPTAVGGINRWLWSNAPAGKHWVKVTIEKDGRIGSSVSTGPVTIGTDYSKAIALRRCATESCRQAILNG
jgi:hypothetical protein